MQIGFIISLVFAIIIAVFAAINSDVVTVDLLLKEFQLSQSLVILLSAVFGAIIAILLSLVSNIKSKLKIRELNVEIKNNLKEIEKLNAQTGNITKN